MTSIVGPHAHEAQNAQAASSPARTNTSPSQSRRHLPTLALICVLALFSVSGCVNPSAHPVMVRRNSALYNIHGHPPELKVVTYNVWGLPSWINRASPDRFKKIATELEQLDIDIALLQEAWTERSLESVPTDKGWSVARTPTPGWLLGRNGLVILSRYPIVGCEFHSFDDGDLPDSLMRKGALKATIAAGKDQLVNVWNVHLQAGDAPRTRARQIAQLAGWVRETDDGQIADLIGGDFNCEPDSGNYRALKSLFGPSQFDLANIEPFFTFDGCCPGPGRARTLDYIFLKSRSKLKAVGARSRAVFNPPEIEERLSDHLGVRTAIRYAPDAASTTETTQVSRSRPFETALFLFSQRSDRRYPGKPE